MFKHGLKSGIPIALGYFAVSFTFGILGVSYGLTVMQTVLISLLNLTSAGQFQGLITMLTPGHWFEMFISQLTINLRYSFMSVSLTQKLDSHFTGIKRWILGFAVTDEIFAVAAAEESVSASFFAGLALLPIVGWVSGTAAGALLGSILPEDILTAMGLALYAMFIAIVVPVAREHRNVLFSVLAAAILSTIFTYSPGLKNLSAGIAISICAVAAAALAALVFPVDQEAKNKQNTEVDREADAYE